MARKRWTLVILLAVVGCWMGACAGPAAPGGGQDGGTTDNEGDTVFAPSTAEDGPDFPDNGQSCPAPARAVQGDDCGIPRVHNLNGLWSDNNNGMLTRIIQDSNAVTALYVEAYVCDHQDGTGQTSETDLNFNATLSGDTLTGQTSTCRFGDCDEDDRIPPFLSPKTIQGNGDDGGCVRGIIPADMVLEVNEEDTELTGTWYNVLLEANTDFSLSRIGCMEKAADDYGLPDGNGVNSEYNALRVYRKDGTIQTVPDDYVLNPETDNFVRYHRGIDYSSRNEDGEVTNLPFTAGVTGTVDVVEGSDWNTINVTLPNGNVVQYLHASDVLVSDGDPVTPDTVLGNTGNTGLGPDGAIHLHVQAKDADGNYIDPDCAESDEAQ